MYDNDFEAVAYNYFKTAPIHETTAGTYADKAAPIVSETISWNHSLAEVFTALLNNGLQIENFQEYDDSPYACFNGTKDIAPRKYVIEKFGDKIPVVYAIVAQKH